MTAYIARRLLSMLPVMAIVALFVFLLLHLAPGDPAAIMAGDNATPDNIAQIRQKLGAPQASLRLPGKAMDFLDTVDKPPF